MTKKETEILQQAKWWRERAEEFDAKGAEGMAMAKVFRLCAGEVEKVLLPVL